MYEFYYDYLQPKYKDKLELLHMDPDCFVLEIETDDFYEDTKKDLKKWFDTSKYHKDMVLRKDYKKMLVLTKKLLVR